MPARSATHALLHALGAGILGSALLVAAIGCKKPVPAEEGVQLFASFCSRCHGNEGTGGLALYDGGPSPRNFHDPAFHLARTDDQIKQTIVNGKGTGMPSFRTMLTDPQLDALVAHLRSLRSK